MKTMKTTATLCLALASGAEAFSGSRMRASAKRSGAPRLYAPQPESFFDPLGFGSEPAWSTADRAALGADAAPSLELAVGFPAVAAAALALSAAPEGAWAKGGEFGLAEGRTISLLHPAVMGVCFFVSLGAAYTGFQWRRVREIAGEITELKTQLKGPEAALAKLQATEAPPAGEVARLAADVAALQADVDAKSAERKALASKDFRDRHWALGSVLLGLGVSFAIEGPVNTFMRAGKLFPGPHLYAGAGCVSLWALAAALVPQMQKGKDWARSGHIGLNVASTALFAYYQIPTGLEIAAKVIEKTKFP